MAAVLCHRVDSSEYQPEAAARQPCSRSHYLESVQSGDVREYQVDEERNSANVKVPQVEVAATDENADSDTVEQAKVSADAINFDINEETISWIEEFKRA